MLITIHEEGILGRGPNGNPPKEFLPEGYVNYELAHYMETYGIIPAMLMLILPPILILLLVYFVFLKKNKTVFMGLLGLYLVYNVFYMAKHIVTISKPLLSALFVFAIALVYWLIQFLSKPQREIKK